MSIHNIYVANNETLYCKRLITDDIDIETLEINNIIVDNATVLTQVTTPHITSGTSLFNAIDTLTINAQTGNVGTINTQLLNSLNIATENIGTQTLTSVSASIDNLTVNNNLTVPSLTTPTVNCDNLNVANNINTFNQTVTGVLTGANASLTNINGTNLTYANGLINNISGTTLDYGQANLIDATLSGNLSAANANIDDLTATNATINALNVNTTLSAPTIISNNISSNSANIANLSASDISANSITAPTANLDSISGTNLNYVNGTIDQLNGGNVQYGTGNINDITGSTIQYSNGDIPTLSTKELTITSAILSCPNASIDNLTINNSLTAAEYAAPNMKVDYVQSFSVGKTTFTENVVVNTQFNCPVVSADTIQTNGSGNINCINPVLAPSLTLAPLFAVPSTPLSYYNYTTGTVNVGAAISTVPVNYRAVRMGNLVSFQLSAFLASTCVVNFQPISITVPGIYTAGNSSRGLVAIRKGAATQMGSWKIAVGLLTIYSGLLQTDFWNIGEVCSIADDSWNFQWVV